MKHKVELHLGIAIVGERGAPFSPKDDKKKKNSRSRIKDLANLSIEVEKRQNSQTHEAASDHSPGCLSIEVKEAPHYVTSAKHQ